MTIQERPTISFLLAMRDPVTRVAVYRYQVRFSCRLTLLWETGRRYRQRLAERQLQASLNLER